MTSVPLSRLAQIWRWGVTRLRKLQAGVLVAGLAISLCLLAFGTLAHEVRESGAPGNFDLWAVRVLRDPADPTHSRGPEWLRSLARDVTAMGSWGVLVFAVGTTVLGLAVARKWRSMWLLFGATTSGLLLNVLMKDWFARERPEFAKYAEIVAGTSSFPSGHSMNSAIVYLTLGTFVSRLVKQRSLQVYVFAAGVGVTLLIGLTRVYLGAHYPTDVLAGVCAGFAWALGWWLVAEVLGRRAAARLPVHPAGPVPAAAPASVEPAVAEPDAPAE